MKSKVAMVSYKNTLPFLYGFEHHPDNVGFDVELLHPAACSYAFAKGDKDIALVPVAFLENRTDYKIISDYCIGSNGPVNSVAILSNKPIKELEKIILDNHSMTSNRLCKILLDNYWNKDMVFSKEDVSEGIDGLPEDTGVVMIGDKVFEHQSNFKHKYDLGEIWNKMTGLPFVFAVWIAKKAVPKETTEKLNRVLAFGVNSIDDILKTKSYNNFDLEEYLKVNLEFNYSSNNKKGLELFLNKYKLQANVGE